MGLEGRAGLGSSVNRSAWVHMCCWVEDEGHKGRHSNSEHVWVQLSRPGALKHCCFIDSADGTVQCWPLTCSMMLASLQCPCKIAATTQTQNHEQ
jgi:hypothetical protein